MVLVRQEGEAASFCVHLQPRASREGIVGEVDGVLKLRVTAPPVDGRANDACLRLLAKALDLPVSRLRITAGQHARQKTIRIADVSADAVRAKLDELLATGPPRPTLSLPGATGTATTARSPAKATEAARA